MSNNLPQIYNENIFKKFFKYIRNLFSFKKKDTIEEQTNTNSINEEKINEKDNTFSQYLKIENYPVDKEFEKKKLMDNLKDNLQLLDDFSNERLEKILQYYLDENEKKKALLDKLSA